MTVENIAICFVTPLLGDQVEVTDLGQLTNINKGIEIVSLIIKNIESFFVTNMSRGLFGLIVEPLEIPCPWTGKKEELFEKLNLLYKSSLI